MRYRWRYRLKVTVSGGKSKTNFSVLVNFEGTMIFTNFYLHLALYFLKNQEILRPRI
jgi:hypothetical protein